MKDKIKKIITIIFIVFAILFGFSWVKSCNNAKDIKTYENVAQMRQKAPKKANEQENTFKNDIVFDSEYIEKIELEGNTFYNIDNKITIDIKNNQYEYGGRMHYLHIYYKKGYVYYYDNFNFDNNNYYQEINYNYNYDFSTMTIKFLERSTQDAITTITLNNELIRHNFDYLTNKSLILNSSLSSQFGDNLFNIVNNDTAYGLNINFNSSQHYEISGTNTKNEFIKGIGYITLPKGIYTLSTQNVVDASSDYYRLIAHDSEWSFYKTIYLTSNTNTTFTINEETKMYFDIYAPIENNSVNCSGDIMLNKGSFAIPFHKFIDISQNNDRVRILTKDNNLNDRTFATYFYSNSYKQLIPKEDLIPIISLENNKLGFAIGMGTETTNQPIYDYNDRVYLNGYGFIPRTLSFSNQFNHNNLNCFILDYYSNGYADYENEILMTEYLLNNSQPFTTEQIDTYNIGYQVGKSDGIYQALEWTNLIKELAKSLESFLNIQILPNITIKLLILVPIMFAILNFIIKLFIK